MELNTKSLFISTIFLACLAAIFITLIILMGFYSCRICTYPYAPKNINCHCPTTSVASQPPHIPASIAKFNTNALGLP